MVGDDGSHDALRHPVLAAYTDDAAGSAVLQAAAVEASVRQVPLRVAHRLVGPEAPEVFGSQEASDATRHRVEKEIRQRTQETAPGCDVEVELFTDSLADHLVLASRTAALVVAGATYTHATTAVLFQALPRELAHRAYCPILLVPATTESQPINQLVCGIDRSPGSIQALHWAANDATLRGTTVLAIEVLGGHRHHDSPDTGSLTSWVQEHLSQPTDTVECGVRHGSAPHVLLEVAAEHHALLAIGAHERHNGHWPRSVARAAMSQTRVPVAIVPSQS
jgi:nucleotide-binding universal stress UspA family protein